MKAVVLKCKAGSQFHFGNQAPDSNTALSGSSDIIHSDTLFSALVNTYNDLNPEGTNQFVEHFEKGEIKISSAFFCFEQSGKYVWFLPKPVSFELFKVVDYKSFKRLKYLSKKVWEQLSTPEELLNSDEVVVVQGEFALMKDELELFNPGSWEYLRVFNSRTLPKVHVRKPTQEDSLYQLGTVEIADNSLHADGLNVNYYFLCDINSENKQLEEKFKTITELLAMNGIGAERSTIGKLEGCEWIDWSLELEAPLEKCAVSLLSPDQHEIGELVNFKTIFRGGRKIGANKAQLKTLRMIEEGCVVKSNIAGNVHDITPEGMTTLKFKRNGKAFLLPINKEWTHE